MYLSKLILNPRNRQVQRDLADSHQLHCAILSAFPVPIPEHERILYRLETQAQSQIPVILVQSQQHPQWKHLIQDPKRAGYLLPLNNGKDEDNPAVKSFSPQFHQEQFLRFCLRANPTVKKFGFGRRQGKRYGLYDEGEQNAWLNHKAEKSGFHIVSARISSQDIIQGQQSTVAQTNHLRLLGVQFDGILQVTDPVAFLTAIQAGIGSGKAFGFGLLSVAPVR